MEKIILDIIFSFIILITLIGPRFNYWPSDESAKYSGLPKDYINIYRYYLFYTFYLLTFVIFIIICRSTYIHLGVSSIFSFPDEINKGFKLIAEALGGGSITFFSLFLCSILNKPKVNEWDNAWRKYLLQLARIPRNVEDLKKHLICVDHSFTPEKNELLKCISYLANKLDSEYWKNLLGTNNIEIEKIKENPLIWKYIKSQYLLYVIEKLNADFLNPVDIQSRKNWLFTTGKELPHINEQNLPDIYKEKEKQLDEHIVYFYECLCKFVVRKHPETERQYIVLKRFGFEPRFSDVQTISLIEPVIILILGITIVVIFSYIGLFLARDYFGCRTPSSGGNWFTYERLFTWTAGSLFCYIISIALGNIMEKISQTKRATANLGIYSVTIVLSTLASLSYFFFARESNISTGHLMIALSLGSIAGVVLYSIEKLSNEHKQDIINSSLKVAIFMGIVHALLSVGIMIGFIHRIPELNADTFISLTYGLCKGFLISYIISYTIQDSIRVQLLTSQRANPRKKDIISLKAIYEDEEIRVVARNISKTGMFIQSKNTLKENNFIKICFPFTAQPILGKIIWKEDKTAGISFENNDPNLHKVHKYIRQKFGEFYA